MYAECGPVVMGDLTNKGLLLSLNLEAVGREPCGHLRKCFGTEESTKAPCSKNWLGPFERL